MGNDVGRVVAGVGTLGLSEIHFQEEDRRRRRRRERELERQREEQRRREAELAAERRRQERLERERQRRARELEEQQRRLRQEQERRDRERREQERRAAEARRRAAEEERRRREKMERERQEARQRRRNALNAQLKDVEKRLPVEQRNLASTTAERDAVNRQLETERQQIGKFTYERDDPNVIRVILLGETGDGKSTIANRLCGDKSEDANRGPFHVSAGVRSCTQRIQKEVNRYTCVDGTTRMVSVVDTPGSSDSGGRDEFHAAALVEFLRGCNGVHLFVLVRNFSNPRLKSFHTTMLTKMAEMFGSGFWSRFCVVLTHVDTGRHRRQAARVMEEFGDSIRGRFGLSKAQAPLPIFGIGLDDYETDLDAVVAHAAGGWYQCDSLRSPHDDLATRLNVLNQQVRTLDGQVRSLVEQRNQINRDLRNI